MMINTGFLETMSYRKIWIANDKAKNLTNSEEYHTIETKLYDLLLRRFPEVQLFMFGSRIMGIGNNASSLEIFIDLNRRFSNEILHYVARRLGCDERWKIEYVSQLTARVRTPLIRLIYRPYNLYVDLVFHNKFALHNFQIMHFYMDLQPIGE